MHLSAPSSKIPSLPPLSELEMKQLFHAEIVRAWREMQNAVAIARKTSSV